MTKRRWKAETRREIVVQLLAEGKSLRQIGKQLGCSHETVRLDREIWLSNQLSDLTAKLDSEIDSTKRMEAR